MRNCTKCNAVLEEDARFCTVCGTPVTNAGPTGGVPQQSQPVNPPQNNADVTPINPAPDIPKAEPINPAPNNEQGQSINQAQNNQQGQPVNQIKEKNTKKKEKTPKDKKKGRGFIIAGVVLLVVSVVVCFAAVGSMGLIKLNKKTSEQYAFYLKDGSLYSVKGKGKTEEITSNFSLDDDTIIYPDYLSFYRKGKTVYFTEKNEASGYDIIGNLVEMDINKKNEKNKIDSEVVADYYLAIDKSFSKMIYYKDGMYYRYNIKKKEKEKLAEVQIGRLHYSDDLNNYIYRDDEDRLYARFGKNDKVKISDDVYSYMADFENLTSNSEIFFITEDDDDDSMRLSVFKNDQKTELIKADYIQCSTYENGKAYFLTSDYEKQKVELYYFNGNAASLCGSLRIDPTYYYTFADENPLMVYLNEDDEYHLLIEGNDIFLFEEDEVVGDVTFSEDGKRFLITTYSKKSNNDSTTGLLYSVSKIGPSYSCKLEKTIYDLGDYWFNKDGNIIYIKDYERKSDVGSLYFEDEFIASDVYAIVGRNADTTNNIYFLKDYDKTKFQGTLYVRKGKKVKMVSSDVKSVNVLDDGSVYYLYDFSEKRQYGDLYYYKGGKPVKIDSEVKSITISNKPLGEDR